jgi:GSH-dependent disulfide-bond oxidoreductase
MIDAYVFTTPNGEKLTIALEELGLLYKLHWIDIMKGEQNTPAFRAINPNGKIPALVDHDGPGGAPIAVFESAAILQYLADKTGKLLPTSGAARYTALEWMAWSVAGLGPMSGQFGHFFKYAKEKLPYAIGRYETETRRLHGVMDKRLGETRYLGGDEYGMADIISISWVVAPAEHYGALAITSDTPNLKRWADEILARPAVQKARALKP